MDGAVWRNRIQTYDSTFTLARPTPLNLHVNSVLSPVPSLPAVSVFDDRRSYYDPANPLGSVIEPNTGTQIRIQSISAQDSFMQVQVRLCPRSSKEILIGLAAEGGCRARTEREQTKGGPVIHGSPAPPCHPSILNLPAADGARA